MNSGRFSGVFLIFSFLFMFLFQGERARFQVRLDLWFLTMLLSVTQLTFWMLTFAFWLDAAPFVAFWRHHEHMQSYWNDWKSWTYPHFPRNGRTSQGSQQRELVYSKEGQSPGKSKCCNILSSRHVAVGHNTYPNVLFGTYPIGQRRTPNLLAHIQAVWWTQLH